MFTGIVEETGKIQAITDKKIVVECSNVLSDTKVGDSIAVNGVCLTVTKIGAGYFTADISPETCKVTALGKLKTGSCVNLERALSANGRLGGHIVSGHVDGIAKIKSIKQNREFYDLEIELEKSEAKYVVKKGSITVNGISLTIAEVAGCVIKLAIIPHTFENTCLKDLTAGDYVNIEVDILAKYVEKFLSTSDNSSSSNDNSNINLDFLQRNGF